MRERSLLSIALIIWFLLQAPVSVAQNIKQTIAKRDSSMDFESLIPRITTGFKINKGEIVLLQLWGENKDLPLLDKFAIEVAKAGGIPVKWQYSREFIREYFSMVPQENLKYPEKYYDIFKPVDIVVDILTYSPAPAPGFPKEKMPFYGQYMGPLFKALTQKKSFIQVKVPTLENANEEGIDPGIFRSAVLRATDIDYSQMRKTCTVLTEEFKNADQVKVYTKDNKIFSFSLKGREWHKDDGAGDIPCGEIYVSPIEESGEGQIFVPVAIIEGQKYNDVTITFSKGKLIGSSEPKVLEYITSAPGDCDILAEFGFGLNPGVQQLIGYAGTDEKCNGTAHIAVGMNYLAGGKNKTPMHYDFLIRPAKVEIDGKTVMNNGEFTKTIKDRLRKQENE